jgi:phospholipid/cholesterol/gamma-HCH transport system permease protein
MSREQGSILEFAKALLLAARAGPRHGDQFVESFALLIRRCILPVSIAVAPVAAVTALQGLAIFRLFGVEDRLSAFIGTTVLREYSPALASVMIAAQAGSSIAARIGTMKLRGQIDALAMLGLDPMRYVVWPGIWACIVVAPLLSVWTDWLGIVAGWVLAVPVGGVDHGAFVANLLIFVRPLDIFLGLAKCMIFGAVVGVLAGYHGSVAQRQAAAVGRAANLTVVRAIVFILAFDYIFGTLTLGGPG